LDVPTQLGNQTSTTKLLVLDEVIGDLLLGVDFLEQCNATLECRGITARIRKNKRNQRRNKKHKTHGIGSLATAEHLVIKKTKHWIMSYYWQGVHRDIQQYVRRCETCQRYKTSQQQAIRKMLTQIAEAPGKPSA